MKVVAFVRSVPVPVGDACGSVPVKGVSGAGLRDARRIEQCGDMEIPEWVEQCRSPQRVERDMAVDFFERREE